MKSKFTMPEICPANPTAKDMRKEWRIRFRYYDDQTGKFIPKAVKGGMNAFHTFKERLKEANALKNAILYNLEQKGWNPLTNTYQVDEMSADAQIEDLKYITFNDALDFAYKKKLTDWSPRSAGDYKSTKKYLQKAADKLKLDRKHMSEFELPHYRMIIDQVAEDRKLSPSGYNKYREHLGTLVTEMKQWSIVKRNDAYDVKTKIEPKRFAHRPPTKKEQSIIMEKIKEVNYPYYVFLCVEYGCTMRPADIIRLKIKDLLWDEGVFRIRSEAVKDITERDVIIPKWLLGLLRQLNLHAYPKDHYIFSTRNKYGSFTPGPKKMHTNTPTNTWRKIVKEDKEKGGLGMDITQYSLKKLAGNDLVKIQKEARLNDLLELPMLQMGHANTKQTEVYVTEHHEVLKELVQNKMPVL